MHKCSIFTVNDLGIKTKEWEKYDFASQFKSGKEYDVMAITSYENPTVKYSTVCKTKGQLIMAVNHIKSKYGTDALIILSPVVNYDLLGNMAVSDVTVISPDTGLNTEQIDKLKMYGEILRRNCLIDKMLFVEWGLRYGEIEVLNIN